MKTGCKMSSPFRHFLDNLLSPIACYTKERQCVVLVSTLCHCLADYGLLLSLAHITPLSARAIVKPDPSRSHATRVRGGSITASRVLNSNTTRGDHLIHIQQRKIKFQAFYTKKCFRRMHLNEKARNERQAADIEMKGRVWEGGILKRCTCT